MMLLALVLLTLNYIGTFFKSKTEAGENSNSVVSRIMASDYLQNFGIFFAGACILLTMLTFVSIVLVLIAIERNTRKNEKAD
jgi:branched-subunit amino acid permease